MDFLQKIKVFGSEHAESVIGVSNALEGFRETAELILKVYHQYTDQNRWISVGKSRYSVVNMQKV